MTITNTELKTYTINATPERYDATDNEARHAGYGYEVAQVFKAAGLDGFTLQSVAGYWQGESEKSYIISVATDKDASTIEKACGHLRAIYNQDAVMLTYPDGRVAFIEA